MAQPASSIERVTPQSIEAEMAVLGAMLLEKEAIGVAIETLGTKEVFYETAHQKIFEALLGLYERNQAVDLLTASEELLRRKQLEEIGGRTYLATLMESVPTAAHIGEYARVVMQKYVLRRLISTANQILAQSYEGRQNVENLLDSAEQAIFGIKEARLRQGFLPVKGILEETFAHLERLHQNKQDVTGLETGFKEFDKLTSGLPDWGRGNRPMKTTRSDLRGYEELLAQKETELLHLLRHRDGIAVERSADQIDEIQCATGMDVVIRSLGRGFDLLREVRAALLRIRNGSFGICLECEGPIGPKRIAALPWAPLCIRCQEAAAARNGHEIGRTLSQVLASAA